MPQDPSSARESRIPRMLRMADEQGRLIADISVKVRKAVVRLIGEAPEKVATATGSGSPSVSDTSVLGIVEGLTAENIRLLQATLFTLSRLEAELGAD